MTHAILAQSFYREAGRYLSRTPSIENHGMLIGALCLILAFWIGLYQWDKWQRLKASREGTPKTLFLELCRLHKLNREQRDLLQSASDSVNPAEQLRVFLDPHAFDQRARDYPTQADQFTRLRQKLFGDPMDG